MSTAAAMTVRNTLPALSTLAAAGAVFASLLARAGCLLRLAWVQFRSAWLPAGDPPPREQNAVAYRVYIFRDDPDGAFLKELPVRWFRAETWEEDAREATPAGTAFRVEVRYTFRHKKYRMVLRPGDACTFPPYGEGSPPACRLPKGVLSARLQGPPGSGIDCDVTPRVMKYQGPCGDFHAGLGLRVRMHDMFPFDDHTDNALRFSHLRLMDTGARLLDLPYDTNPAVTLCKAE